jgi:hypothetical protein
LPLTPAPQFNAQVQARRNATRWPTNHKPGPWCIVSSVLRHRHGQSSAQARPIAANIAKLPELRRVGRSRFWRGGSRPTSLSARSDCESPILVLVKGSVVRDVRFGSLADMAGCPIDVSLPPKADIPECDRRVNPVGRKVGRTTAPGQAVSCASFG